MTENSLRAKQIVGTFSDLADSLLLGKTETLNETIILKITVNHDRERIGLKEQSFLRGYQITAR